MMKHDISDKQHNNDHDKQGNDGIINALFIEGNGQYW